MAKSTEDLQKTLSLLEDARCTAVLRTPSDEDAVSATDAVIAGGFKAIEFTLTIPGCLDLVRKYSAVPGLIIGVGTILNIEQCKAAVEAGAHFLVSPVSVMPVIRWCAANNVVIMAGTYTPTEMYNAHVAGAHVVKLFPGAAGGAAFVRGVKGPMPFLRVVPTTGATLENCGEYFAAGAFGIGFTGVLFDPADMAARNWGAIRERAGKMIAACNAASRPPQMRSKL